MPVKPDLSEFYKLSKPKRAPCQVGHVLGLLGADEAVQLDAACKTDQGIITNAAVREWLLARDHDVSINRVVSHRKGTCTCHD